MDKKAGWLGGLMFIALFCVHAITRSAWCLLVIPAVFLLSFVLELIFDHDKAEDYAIVTLIVIDILLAIPAVKLTIDRVEEVRVEHNIDFCPSCVPLDDYTIA